LVSAIVRPDDRTVLRVEAERLAELLNLAATQASLTGRPVAWTADESSYRFWRGEDSDLWSEIDDDELLRARTLPQGISISAFSVENTLPQGTMRLVFAPRGSSLAFTIEIALGSQRYSIAGSPLGEVRAIPGESETARNVASR
jgi:general secretion pathway protein H